MEGRTLAVEKAKRGRARTPTPGRYHGPPKRDGPRRDDRRRYDDDRRRYDDRRDPRDYRARSPRGDYRNGYDRGSFFYNHAPLPIPD